MRPLVGVDPLHLRMVDGELQPQVVGIGHVQRHAVAVIGVVPRFLEPPAPPVGRLPAGTVAKERLNFLTAYLYPALPQGNTAQARPASSIRSILRSTASASSSWQIRVTAGRMRPC